MMQRVVATSNVMSILRAIERIALTVSPSVNGAPGSWAGNKIYAVPTPDQISAVGTPFLAVDRPRLVGYTESVGLETPREAQASEPVWELEVYSFHPYDASSPNYDDAARDMKTLHRTFMINEVLPWTSTVQDAPAPTTTTFAVDPGDGQWFNAEPGNNVVFFDGMPGTVIASIDGDVVTLARPLDIPPAPGSVASQGTCYNSYPYNVMPDYAELTGGGPWTVAYMIVRAFEQLIIEFEPGG